MEVRQAVLARHSVRAFQSVLPDLSIVEQILLDASRAPSQGNTQPWRVRVLTGQSLLDLSTKIKQDYDADPRLFKKIPPYEYYPKEEFDPWFARRSAVAEQLYSSLDIGRRDVVGRREQIKRNFDFFDAPVGLIFSMDQRMETGSWTDYGAFLQNIMLLAVEQGLDTCAMGIFILYEDIIAQHCNFTEDETILCAMALGYKKADAPENNFVTPRATDFITFMS